MSEIPAETVVTLQRLALPYGKELELMEVTYENGFPILRLRIREGKRFTMLDLDAAAAAAWGGVMAGWAAQHGGEAHR